MAIFIIISHCLLSLTRIRIDSSALYFIPYQLLAQLTFQALPFSIFSRFYWHWQFLFINNLQAKCDPNPSIWTAITDDSALRYDFQLPSYVRSKRTSSKANKIWLLLANNHCKHIWFCQWKLRSDTEPTVVKASSRQFIHWGVFILEKKGRGAWKKHVSRAREIRRQYLG